MINLPSFTPENTVQINFNSVNHQKARQIASVRKAMKVHWQRTKQSIFPLVKHGLPSLYVKISCEVIEICSNKITSPLLIIFRPLKLLNFAIGLSYGGDSICWSPSSTAISIARLCSGLASWARGLCRCTRPDDQKGCLDLPLCYHKLKILNHF